MVLRTLADVLLTDGANVNHKLVQEGWCWWYRKYAPGNTALEKLEMEAREARRGLWANLHPCRRGSGGRGNSGFVCSAQTPDAVGTIER